MELAELAANEQDPKKLLELVREINDLLEQKQHRLAHLPPRLPNLLNDFHSLKPADSDSAQGINTRRVVKIDQRNARDLGHYLRVK